MLSNANWISKLQVECTEEPDGSLLICISWDETDPDLYLWTSWGEEGQKAFMIDALHQATECYHNE
jgi:hypothetical protein